MESAEAKFERAADTLASLRKRVGKLKAEMKELASEYALDPSAEIMEFFTEVHRRERMLVGLLRGVDNRVKNLMHEKTREHRARQDEASARRQERAERKRQREEEKRQREQEKREQREQRKEEIRQRVLEEFRDEHGRDVLPGEEQDVHDEIRKRVAALD